MSSLRSSLQDYLATRRAAGFALRNTATTLNRFVAFAEQQGAERITTQLALGWAQRADVQPAWRAQRVGMVLSFSATRRAGAW